MIFDILFWIVFVCSVVAFWMEIYRMCTGKNPYRPAERWLDVHKLALDYYMRGSDWKAAKAIAEKLVRWKRK